MQPNIDRMVAIKILHPKLVNRKDLVSRFSREAKALGHLSHPNTVKVFDDGVLEDGSLFIVMEYLEGRNLNQVVRTGGPIPLERALPILIQVCGALNEAHSRGIVHRDLKPENIFLSTQGGIKDFPKVLDFGLAKVTDQEMRPGSIVLTQEGMVFGTPEFMSPEQAQGKTLDARSDLYSLAIILYQMLVGRPPFEDEDAVLVMARHIKSAPPTFQEISPHIRVSPALEQVVQRALSKNPDERPSSAEQFIQLLDEALAGGGNESGVRRAVGLHPWRTPILAGFFGALVLLLIGGAFALWRPPSEPRGVALEQTSAVPSSLAAPAPSASAPEKPADFSTSSLPPASEPPPKKSDKKGAPGPKTKVDPPKTAPTSTKPSKYGRFD
jgi:serine/threonine-protein kinase